MRTVLTIGREPDNDLVINLPIVSGHHARVTWEGVPGQARHRGPWFVERDGDRPDGSEDHPIDLECDRPRSYFGNHPGPRLGAARLGRPVDGAEPAAPRDRDGGRAEIPGCHRVIDRPTISGRHARFKRSGERIVLEDLGSSNGTFVNGEKDH